MNIHAQTQHTPAETALIEAFGERLSHLPGNGSVMVKRDAAIEMIRNGLPTRRIESWHYTDFRRLLTAVPPLDRMLAPETVAPVVEGSAVLSIRNGIAADDTSDIGGVTVARVKDKLADGTYAPALETQGADDAIGALNTAFVTDGYFLDIAEGAEVTTPIELQNLHAGGQTHVRLPVRVDANAKATIIERQTGTGEALVSAISNIVVGDGAELVWVIVQDQPGDVTHLGQLNAWIGKDAKLTVFIVNAGGKLVRQEVRVVAKGEGAEFTLRGVNLLSGDSHTDVTMVLDHAAAHTESTEIIRNVVTDRAHGVFQGMIKVAKDAQKTDAKMSCNTLLLSDDAEFSTKPELEIFADDVVCGHGATVTEIDHDHLFYLMARGIDEKTARGLLIKAFVAEIVEELKDESLVAALEAKLDSWFVEHG